MILGLELRFMINSMPSTLMEVLSTSPRDVHKRKKRAGEPTLTQHKITEVKSVTASWTSNAQGSVFASFFNISLQIYSEIQQWKMNEALWIKCHVIKTKLCFTSTLISGAGSQCEEKHDSVTYPEQACVKFPHLELECNSGVIRLHHLYLKPWK